MAAQCRIELFGGLRVTVGDRTITRFRTQKTAALLAYLAYHRDRIHPRETLIGLLWPWSGPDAGLNSLSTALSSLRHQLEPPGVSPRTVLIADRESVGLNPEGVATDVNEFALALRTARKTTAAAERREHLGAAVALYRGELLSGLYEDWITQEQVQLSEQFARALSGLIRLLVRQGDTAAAIDHARRAIQVDRLREAPYRDLMRLFIARDEPAAALRVFHELEHALQQELGETPSAAMRRLAHALAQQGAARIIEERRGSGAGRAAPLGPAGPARSMQRPPRGAARARAPIPSGTVTFLLGKADVGPAPKREACLRREFRRHGGTVVEADGTSFVAVFRQAGDAVNCATACQRALADLAPPAGRASGGRIAVHSSDVTARDGTSHDSAWQRAWRIVEAIHGNQIVCSEAAAGLLRHDLNGGLWLRDLGAFRLCGASFAERLFQIVYPGMEPGDSPPLNAEASYASNLPPQVTRLFGRESELSEIAATLDSGGARLVTLTGPPGSGKTRLAIAAAGRLLETFRGAVWYVPLADLRDESRILDHALGPLGILPAPQTPALEQIVAALAAEPALLVFDNFEHLSEGAGAVRALLERLPNLSIMVTSRRGLGLTGEQAFPVRPLPVPTTLAPEELPLLASVQLFVDRAQAVRPDFQLTAANASAVAELCRRLEGVPLAIELAAAQSQALSPAAILTRLEQGADLTAARAPDGADRHRSLRTAVQWSYELLPPPLQRFFVRLSVFRGGWTAEAAEAVCEEPLALDYLFELVESSLIVVERELTHRELTEPRFRMLDMIRQFAADTLAASGLEVCTRARHFDYFHKLGELLVRRDQVPYLRRVQADLDNFLAAMDASAIGDEGLEDQFCISCALSSFWITRDQTLGRKVYAQLLQRDQAGVSADMRGQMHNNAGVLAWML